MLYADGLAGEFPNHAKSSILDVLPVLSLRSEKGKKRRYIMAIEAKLVGKKLTITVDVNTTPTLSSTGKSLVVASSHGNQATAIMVQGKPVMVGLNAFIKA